MKTLLNKRAISFLVFFSALFISVAYAESLSEVTFPVKELGNCESKEECKAYCDEESNISACRAFARENNLENNDEERNFEKVKEDGGPGGCAASGKDPIASCEKYCDDTAHMKECVAYAKTHDLMDSDELAEAEKVVAALDRGAKLPTGCTNKKTCESICEAPANMKIARECFDFAEEAGLLPPEVNREQAEKVFKAIEEGRAPFKSPRDFEQCEKPASDEIMEKCVNFALENGFLSGEEAEMVKKTGGKGPGGCRGKRECEAFCEANQDECVAFAEKYDLLSAEQKAQMEEGVQKFKEGFGRAPDEVKECLRSTLGSETVDQILAGNKRLSRMTGEGMRECFDKQKREGGEGAFPPEVKSCILSQIGEEGFKELTEKGPTPELDQKMRECFEKRGEEGRMEGGREGEGYRTGEQGGIMERRMDEGFRPEGEFRGSPDGEYPRYLEGTEGQVPGEANQMPPEGYQMPGEIYQRPPEEYQMSEGTYTVPTRDQPPESYIAPPAEPAPAPAETAPVPAPAIESAPQSGVEKESMSANLFHVLKLLFE